MKNYQCDFSHFNISRAALLSEQSTFLNCCSASSAEFLSGCNCNDRRLKAFLISEAFAD